MKKIKPDKENRSKKSLIAIAFASGILFPQISLSADNNSNSTNITAAQDSVIAQLSTNQDLSPEVRAYYLLRVATDFLIGTETQSINARYANLRDNLSFLENVEKREGIFVSWADQIDSDKNGTSYPSNSVTKSNKKVWTTSAENMRLADKSAKSAVRQLEKASKSFTKLSLHFIALRVFTKLGDTIEARKCEILLNTAISDCEKNPSASAEERKATASVLNLMSNESISLRIADPSYPWGGKTKPLESYSERNFLESESLRLRAAAILDKLPAIDHARRMAHRNLTLWYRELGKKEKSEQQKQLLFQLVGDKSDSLLYPRQAGCGHIVWWETKAPRIHGACGMG
jgi:hypothetical protein